jgi:hypothetical protein
MRNKSCCQNINSTKIAQGVLAGMVIIFVICMGISISGCGGGDGGSYNPVGPTSTCTPVNPTATSVPTATKTPGVNPTATPTVNVPTPTPTVDPNAQPSDPNNISTYPNPLAGCFSTKVTTVDLNGGKEERVGNVPFSFTNKSTGKVYNYMTNSDGVVAVMNLPIGNYDVKCSDLGDERTVNYPSSAIYITNFRRNIPSSKFEIEIFRADIPNKT